MFEISFPIQSQKIKANKNKNDKIVQPILHKLQAILWAESLERLGCLY